MGVFYATREQVKAAMDAAETARNDTQVDRAVESGSRTVEALTRRRFYPWTGTRYFPWPPYQPSRPWRLWLDADELVSVATLVVGGVTVSASDYFLEPVNSGPPYSRVEIDLSSSAAFSSGPTRQRAVAVTGVWCGCDAQEAPAGALAEALDSSETGVDVTDSSVVGVGTIIRVDSERMIVTGRSMLDTAQNCSALTASSSDVAVTGITAGTIKTGEVILVDSERMLVVAVAGTTLTVKRAWDGTVLAAHNAGADIYAPRTLTVTRGSLGTTAATHADTTPIVQHMVPALVRDLAVAEAINQLQQETSGYAHIVGEGENAREGTGRSLYNLRRDTIAAYGRQARTKAV
jgi:hypothetical protein